MLVRLIHPILLRHRCEILGDNQIRSSERFDDALLQPHGSIAERLDVAGGVRDEQNRDAALPELVHLAHAPLAEIDVAHGERFIDQQDFRIDVDRHRERQPDDHAARIRLHRLVE